MAWWQQYTGFLRGLRPVYTWYNFRHRKALQYNLTQYRKFGLQQSVFSSISSARFSSMPVGDIPWLDRPGADAGKGEGFNGFSEEIQQQLLLWPEKGYLVLRNFFSKEQVAAVNTAIETLLQQGEAGFNYTGKKIMQAWQHSEAVRSVFTDERLCGLLGFLLGKPVLPFHTINFLYGSEQQAHSDAIHMATYPKGYLVAAWVALDAISDANGPLFVYPGSHRLPYPTNASIGTNSNRLWLDQKANEKYERYAAQLLAEGGFQKETFYAQPGDVLIWHANLVHGGAPQKDMQQTRRSIAMHYFAEGVIPYHEISERPAIFEQEMLERYHRSSSKDA
jgi:ectoine hydroxylase